MSQLVEIDHLSKTFGSTTVVNDLTFSVDRGEVLGFLGPNGAGKSTTMKMLTGFLPPSSGTARVAGHDVLREPLALKRALGYLPEGAPSYAEMTPLSFLQFVAGVRGARGSQVQEQVDRAVARTQLHGVLHQRIETLSKGFKRRVGLAQAILHDPEVLILDEPTDGLDPNQKHEVRALIREMGKDKAIILSTHILEEVFAVCTRVIIIANGRMVVDDTPEGLSPDPRRLDDVFRKLTTVQAPRDEKPAAFMMSSGSGRGDARAVDTAQPGDTPPAAADGSAPDSEERA
ncbi:MAG: hypothetical protein DHS20C15_12550 [Planctomycetota bacterium]|nr:MAG: hypothetical protein DHS20C15_12550 [Planctomycetota bacterium]